MNNGQLLIAIKQPFLGRGWDRRVALGRRRPHGRLPNNHCIKNKPHIRLSTVPWERGRLARRVKNEPVGFGIWANKLPLAADLGFGWERRLVVGGQERGIDNE